VQWRVSVIHNHVRPMALKLYRRHRTECEGSHPEDSRSGEFEEGRRGWRRCACQIHASGTGSSSIDPSPISASGESSVRCFGWEEPYERDLEFGQARGPEPVPARMSPAASSSLPWQGLCVCEATAIRGVFLTQIYMHLDPISLDEIERISPLA
jgi:hypothetical protein